jgi:DNA-binding transcriptional regulator LsrR (DeoR family)
MLTLEQEEKICQEYLNTNITQKELGIQYNTNQPNICKILKKFKKEDQLLLELHGTIEMM